MCNLYSLTRTPEELRRAFRIMHDRTGNLPPLPDIFPDQLAPVVRTEEGWRARADDDAVGFPASACARHTAGDECPQCQEPVLARMAEARLPLPGAGDQLLRVHGQPAESAALVRPRRELALSSPLPAFGDLGPARAARRQPLPKASTCCSHS